MANLSTRFVTPADRLRARYQPVTVVRLSTNLLHVIEEALIGRLGRLEDADKTNDCKRALQWVQQEIRQRKP
jgi:hypothetical protein